MNQRISIYARYSSDLQSEASIEDQIRLCSKKAASEDWSVVNCYTDAGISGATGKSMKSRPRSYGASSMIMHLIINPQNQLPRP